MAHHAERPGCSGSPRLRRGRRRLTLPGLSTPPDDAYLSNLVPEADEDAASFSTYLAAGTYHLGIDGVGFGTPLASTPTGYTDYGSLGQYLVSGTLQSTTQPPPTTTLQVLDPNGAAQLRGDTSTDLVSVQVNGVTSAVRFQGAQLKACQFSGWQILAAETAGSNQNQMLWKELSTGRLHTWSVDSNWTYISSEAIVTPTSSAGLLLQQQQCMVNANGTPLTTKAQSSSLEAVDAIIGGGTSLAPEANDAFAYDRTVLAGPQPENLIFRTKPILPWLNIPPLARSISPPPILWHRCSLAPALTPHPPPPGWSPPSPCINRLPTCRHFTATSPSACSRPASTTSAVSLMR